MSNYQVRTDLALEARESISEAESELRGVRVEEYYHEEDDIRVTKVMIDTKNAAKAMGKPMGVYVTMEAPAMVEPDDGYHREISQCLADELKEMIPNSDKEQSVLVVGLGNREVTADALGPQVVDNLFITRHVVKTYGKAAYNKQVMNQISSIEPGVMAKTGMETAEIIKGVVDETKPDVIVVIDALAARSTKRLNRTVQITNTGIQPGSGVGNHRNALTMESLGVPVIAIGVPTVVDAATIVGDALEKILSGDSEFDHMKYMGQHRAAFSELNNMYMTGKDIDAVVKRVSFTVSEGINLALELKEERCS
ncbi:MAG: GPR endopeptidase [Lachnospiraceae bacterium]|nr:GPR endopeptidase [Lachnospiraceae bacterium]